MPGVGWVMHRTMASLSMCLAVFLRSSLTWIPGTLVEIGVNGPAMFRRGVGLGVPGVHLRHSALLEDDEDAFRFAFATANRGVHRGSWEAKGTQTAGPQPQHIASVEVLGRSVGYVGLAIARGKAILAIAPAMLGSFKGGCDSLCLPLFSCTCGL